MSRNKVAAIILAAGRGERMGRQSKASLSIGGRPMLAYSLDAFRASPEVDQIIVVMNQEDLHNFEKKWGNHPLEMGADIVVPGGSERWISCWEGFKAVHKELEITLVHDVARPLVSPELINLVSSASLEHGAAFAGSPVSDSLHYAINEKVTLKAIDRESMWAAQTPQGALTGNFAEAFKIAKKATKPEANPPDEASLLRMAGIPAFTVLSPHVNLKVTWPDDLNTASTLLADRSAPWSSRIGQGRDTHRLVKGSPCMVGGVPLDCGFQADSHSDGDAVLHALADAILGGSGSDDLGTLFPDTDPKWENADSSIFVREAIKHAAKQQLKPASVDIVVCCDAPRIGPNRAAIRESIASLVGLPISHVNIKGKTTEGLNATSIEATAVVLLVGI
ncbi:MAG TPA: 2-C-methyl-D-erythritol 2,4-cyclodiphosphate synthase [Planctomycetes bacterium]|nr:2-C-methyl-D-erythritol 2,4-cyclodiphosphate synthase [Planctomycetota bacterium]